MGLKISKKKYPFCYSGNEYAEKVINGDIIACKQVIGSCKRYFKDLERAEDDQCSFYFDLDLAERFLRLAQKFKHVKGNWDNPCIIYESWQNFIFMNVFGFISKITGSRRFRTCHIEVPRGNGKSAIASQVGLYMLALENPKGNEVYSAATGRDQARIILDSARAMARANKGFLKATGVRVLAHQVVHEKSESFFRALSADSNTLDGLQPVCALIDELHSHKNRSVYDVIDSAMSKRRDSLLFVITTAGFDTSGIGYSQSAYCSKICNGDFEDDSFFGIVYTIDEKDDPYNRLSWIKANPNWGISVDPINFESKAMKAKENPSDQNNFNVKHLNVWTNSASPFFNVRKWDLCTNHKLSLDDFKGEKCWVGIDLASKIDLTSFAYIFKRDNKYYFFTENFIPEQTIIESKNDLYPKWVASGDVIKTKGEAINYSYLEEVLFHRSRQFKFIGVHYDPWNATELAQIMSGKRIEMIEFRMTVANLSEPMKKIDASLREERFIHRENSCERWCLGNVVAKVDANDNVFPRKDNDQLKIDPIVAAIMAMAGWVQEEENESVYEKRGIIII